jgi:hypothetical protein
MGTQVSHVYRMRLNNAYTIEGGAISQDVEPFLTC